MDKYKKYSGYMKTPNHCKQFLHETNNTPYEYRIGVILDVVFILIVLCAVYQLIQLFGG